MFFELCDLNKTKLPTEREVLQYLLFLKHYGTPTVAKNKKLIMYSEHLLKELCDLWHRANIPIKSNTTIRKYIGKLVKKHYVILRHPAAYKENDWNKLFTISQCNCGIESNMLCKCAAVQKIPENAVEFFIDQCGPRLLSFEDEPEQADVVEMADEAEDILEDQSEFVSTITKPSPISAGYEPDTADEEEFATSRRDVSPPVESQLKVSDIRLRNFSSALDRSDTSVRFGSLHATMLIKDLRLSIAAKAIKDYSPDIAEKLTKYFDDLIIDKNKVQRERSKFRIEAEEAAKYHGLLKCISFDGKKEETLKKIIASNRARNIKVLEEHITIVKEPDSKFIGYATPTVGTGVGIQNAIVNFLNDKNYNMDHLVAISCDGTVTNTGYKNGVIAFMERYLQRPLQWFVCLFHFNELPFNALLRAFLGKQKGPGIWPGEIGTGIQNCKNYPVSFVF